MEALIGIFFLILLAGIPITVGVVLYLRAVLSRKAYRCPRCGEHISVELMRASHCNACGEPLYSSEDDDGFTT